MIDTSRWLGNDERLLQETPTARISRKGKYVDNEGRQRGNEMYEKREIP